MKARKALFFFIGILCLNTSFAQSVTITSTATSNTICSGSSVTFTATAIGFTSPAYQWYKNTVAISGAKNATYTTTTLSNNDQISVSCINSPGIVNDSTLSLWLDAEKATSYSGTGTTWTNIGTGGATYNAAINAAHQTYSSNNGGYFEFDNTANPMLINKVTSAVTEVTMSTWVYITPGTTQGAFIKNGGSLGYTFGAGGGGGFCSSNFPGMLLAGQGWIGSYPPASNFLTGWQLCTMVISGLNPTTYKYYINGTLANTATFTGAFAPTGNYTALGDNYGDGGACTTFNSKMGAAYIYTKALSNAEIIQNYNASASRFGLSTIGTAITSNTITTIVTTNNTITAASYTPILCVNTVLTNSTYTTTGATGIATATGLPAGVTATFASNTITLSGTPTVSGTFNYSIPLTGGCGSLYATGTITVNQIASVSSAQVLVVAGGGSGGVGRGQLGGAGGGAGGVVYSNTYLLSSGTYNVTVGDGGSSITNVGPINGNNGANSVFGTLTAVGGGGGGSDGQQGSLYFGLNGGSGGGSAVWATSAGSSTQTTQINETNHYGTSGGLSTVSNVSYAYVAGGGGGAGHAGYTPNLNGYGNYGGNGGEGITIPFSSGSPTGYFAAGGGGSGAANNRGIGGSSIGGSGDGLNSNTASSGVTNTGSGGGGSSGHISGAGGSGVVIIQYLGTPIATGGTITQSNGYTIHTFTSSGTFSNGLAIISSPQTLCQNATATALTSTLSGIEYTFQWYSNNLPSNIGGTIITGATSNSYTPSSTNAGTTYYYIVVTNSSGCSASSGVSDAIIITENNSVNAASSSPVLCINTTLSNISHATSGATGIGTATGLPAGVIADFASNIITISGMPTVAGTFNYSIPLTGGCGSVNATGSITVIPIPTVNVTVSGDTCVNKTTLSTTSGLTSYAWYRDNLVIPGATSNIYVPTSAGDHKIQVSNGTCNAISSITTIIVCGLTSDGKMIPVVNSTTLVNKNGAKNSGKGMDERGLILTKPIYYGTVTTRTGRIWLDRNLGATRVALSPTDSQAYGDYYQWGRPTDGHEKQIVSGTASDYTTVKSTTSMPGNSNYIFPSDGSFDWLTTADNTLWTGVNAPNNPCPAGFRIPTLAEWLLEKSYFTSNDVNGSYENGYGLKLTTAGMGTSANGITGIGVYGQYLTQTAYSTGQVRYFGVISWTTWDDNNYYKTTGQSCRCIKD